MKKKFVRIILLMFLVVISCGCGSGDPIKEKSINSLNKEAVTATPATEEKIVISAPTGLGYYLSGSVLMVYWDEVPNATGYEVTFGQTSLDRTTCYMMSTVTEGKSYDISLRAYYKKGNTTITSDWVKGKYQCKAYDYSKMGYGTATCLSKEQVLKWANTKGYKCEEGKDGDYTFLTVYYEDSLNKGFLSGLGRTLKSAAAGFVKGYADNLQDDFSDLQSTLDTVQNSKADTIKGFIAEEDRDSTKSGVAGAIYYGFQAALVDTNIKHVYVYRDDRFGAEYSITYMLQNKHEDLVKNLETKLKKSSDGRLLVSGINENETLYIKPTTITTEGCKMWAIVCSYR